jgi:hypothetical protein
MAVAIAEAAECFEVGVVPVTVAADEEALRFLSAWAASG